MPTYKPNHYLQSDGGAAGEPSPSSASSVFQVLPPLPTSTSNNGDDDDAKITMLEPQLAPTTDANGNSASAAPVTVTNNKSQPPPLRTATSVVDMTTTMANTQKHGDKDDDAAAIGENQNSINVNACGSGRMVPEKTSNKVIKCGSYLKYEGVPYTCSSITDDGQFKIRCLLYLPAGSCKLSPDARWCSRRVAKTSNPLGVPYRCPGGLLVNRETMESTTITAHECTLVLAAGGVSSDTAHADEEALPTADSIDQSLSETADLDSSATTGGAHHMDLNGAGIADFGSNAHGDKDNEDIDNNVYGDKDGTSVATDKSTAVTESVVDVAQVAQAEERDGVIAAVASENQDSINVNACDSGRMVPEKTSNKVIKCGSYLKYEGVPYTCSSITNDGQFKIRCSRYLGSCKLSPDARWCSRRVAIASNPSGFPYRCPGVLLVNRETMESTTISTHECMLASAAAVAGGVSSNTAQEEEPFPMADSIDQSHNEMADLDSSATTDGAHQMDSDGTCIEDINNNDRGDEDIDNNDYDDEDGTSVASDKSLYKDLCVRLTSALVNRQQQFKILKANHEKRDNQYKRLKVEHENQSQAFKRLKVEHENLKLRFSEASNHRYTDHHTPASFSEKYA